MKIFEAFFWFEFKRLLCKRNLIFMLLLSFLLAIFANIGIKEYKASVRKGEELRNMESIIFSKLHNYMQYSIQGVRLMFIPSPLCIFSANSTIFTNLEGRINPVISLDIYSGLKSNELSPAKLSVPMDFSGLLFLVGSFIALLYGCDAMGKRSYLKFLSSFGPEGRVFWAMHSARLILMLLLLSVIFLIPVVLLVVNDIRLGLGEWGGVAAFISAALIMLFFCYFTGVILGSFRSRKVGVSLLMTAWFLFAFVVPGSVNTYIGRNFALLPSSFQTELQKQDVVTKFEARATNSHGPFNRSRIEQGREVIEEYWKNDYRRIEDLEWELRQAIGQSIQRYKRLAVLTPTTFFQLTANEVSSRGYENYLQFYCYLREMQKKFVRFYIDRCYYNDPTQMVSFIKGDENLFHAGTVLPGNFAAGVCINLVYILLLMGWAYARFRSYLYTVYCRSPLKQGNPPIIIKSNEFKALLIFSRKGFNEKLYNLLSGRLAKEGSDPGLHLEIGGRDFSGQTVRADFLYLCSPGSVPDDIRAGDWLGFLRRLLKLSQLEKANLQAALASGNLGRKTFGQLDNFEKGEVFLAVLPYFKHKIFLVDNVTEGMPVEFITRLNDIMRQWNEAGSAVLFLTTKRDVQTGGAGKSRKRNFDELEGWSEYVARLKELGVQA